jgi:Icc protein
VSYRGIDARGELARLLPAVAEWGPDLLLLTGDLAEDEAEPSYAWLAGELAALKVPVLAIPGNHDDAEALGRHFEASAPRGLLIRDLGDWRLVIMDSAVPGEVSGRLREETLDQLDRALGEGQRPALVALHHQPLPVGSPWIDRYPLLDPSRVWSVLRRHGARVLVWGHIHQPFSAELEGIRALGCPSTASNSVPGQERFLLDGLGPAARWLELGPDGALETGILRP